MLIVYVGIDPEANEQRRKKKCETERSLRRKARGEEENIFHIKGQESNITLGRERE